MRFCHLNFDSFGFFSSKRLIVGLPSIKNSGRVCDIIILGKHHIDVFQTGKSWRVRKSLEIIHSNLYTVEVFTNDGCRYFITFINDFSKKKPGCIFKTKI